MNSKITTELLRLAAGGGIALDGACWSPAGQARTTAVALFPGTGGEFCHSPMGDVGPLLAAAGYRVLSLNRRDHGALFGHHRFADAAMDQGLAVDWLATRGARRVVMAGHSYGTLTVPRYLAATDDARVPAAILFAPLGDLRAASVTIVGGQARYDAIVADCRARVVAGRGDEVFLIPPMVPGTLPLVHTRTVFLDKRGPEAETVGATLIARTGERPLLGIRDPADPFPATLPPARAELEAANARLDYVLLDDIRDGRMDAEAHFFAGRAGEVARIVLDWLAAHGLDD